MMNPESIRAMQAYRDRFGAQPLGVARAPGRVNLIGEHIDYNEGWVLPAAIERSVYLAFGAQEHAALSVASLDLDRFAEAPLPDANRAAEAQAGDYPDWLRYGAGVSWALQRTGRNTPGLQGVLCSSVPLGSGLSSSAALEAAFATAWQALGGWTMERMAMAQACQLAEHTFAGVRCGIMDQFASLHGRRGAALLLDCRSLAWREVALPAEAVVVIANTRSPHKLETSAYNERRGQCEAAVQILAGLFPQVRSLRDATPEMVSAASDRMPELVRRRAEHVVGECARTVEAAAALEAGDLIRAGALMNASHESLRDLYDVSGPELEAMVAAARGLPGCYGARLTGAGFGGCTVQLVDQGQAQSFVAELANRYCAMTGITPEIIMSAPSAGAEFIPLH
jgi:galactokinase